MLAPPARSLLSSNNTFLDGLSPLVLPKPTVDKLLLLPLQPPGHPYNYANRPHMYDDRSNSNSSSYSSHNNSYPVVTHSRVLSPHPDNHRYLSHSPSPVDPPSHHTSFPHPLSAPHTQHHFPPQQLNPPSSASSFHTDVDRFSPLAATDRYPRPANHHPAFHGPLLDHRRMSEPAIFGSSASNPYALPPPSRFQQVQFAYNSPHHIHRSSPYAHTLQRGISTGSLRDLREQQQEHQPVEFSQPGWKHEDDHIGSSGLDEPISPLHPTFSGGGTGSPSLGISGLQYPPIAEDPYGPSPPGTGTSTSSTAPNLTHSAPPPPSASSVNNSKTYAFVSLPGNAVKKRPRRRYDEIERLYQCSWPDCSKAYGTLNHLNAHVTMQKHGPKRSPNEFKELRKQWRKAKKEESDVRGPTGSAVRRTSTRRDSEPDLQAYARDTSFNQQSQHRLSLGLPSSVLATSLPIEDMRFPPQEELECPSGEEGYGRHQPQTQRYGGAPASWHQGMTMPPSSSTGSRSMHPHYQSQSQQQLNLSVSIPNSSPMAPLSPPGSSSSATVVMNRLPPDSTLLTPLPGYEPPANIQFGYSIYGDDDGGRYDDDGRRPGTGHSVYGEDLRPGTGHASLGGGSAEGDYDL